MSVVEPVARRSAARCLTSNLSMVSIVLLVVAVVLPPVTSSAEGLSLEAAIEAARQDSNRIKVARDGATAAESSIKVAKSNNLPTLGLRTMGGLNDGDVLYNRFVGPPPDPNNPQAGTPVGEFDSTKLAALRISQIIYAGGGNRARIDESKIQHEMAKLDTEITNQDLSFEVTRQYYSVLVAEKAVEVAGEIVERAKENLSAVERLVAEQEALQADLLGAQAQVASAEVGLLQASNDFITAGQALNMSLGRDLDTPVELTDSLDAPEQRYKDHEIVSYALSENPGLAQARMELDLADASTRKAKSLKRFKVSLDGNYQWIDNQSFYEGSTYNLTLNFKIPFFADFKAGKGAVGSARAQRSAAEHMLNETSAGVELQVRDANRRMRQAYAGIKAAEKNLEYKKERYRTTLSAFKEQLATFNDVVDDHTKLYEAERTLLGAQYQARMAEAELKRTMGTL